MKKTFGNRVYKTTKRKTSPLSRTDKVRRKRACVSCKKMKRNPFRFTRVPIY